MVELAASNRVADLNRGLWPSKRDRAAIKDARERIAAKVAWSKLTQHAASVSAIA